MAKASPGFRAQGVERAKDDCCVKLRRSLVLIILQQLRTMHPELHPATCVPPPSPISFPHAGNGGKCHDQFIGF